MTKSLHFSGINKQGRSITSVLLFICGLFKHILHSTKAVEFPEGHKKTYWNDKKKLTIKTVMKVVVFI